MRSWFAGAVGTMMVAVNVGAAGAQTHAFDRGSLRIGGSGNIASASVPSQAETDTERQTVIRVSPMVEFFVVPGLSVGGTLGFNRTSVGDVAQTTLAVGPSAAYYFHTPGGRLHPYLAAAVNFGRTSFDGTAQNWRSNQSGYRGAGGLIYLLAPNVGLTGELFYMESRFSADDLPVADVSTNAFGFAAGFSVYLF